MLLDGAQLTAGMFRSLVATDRSMSSNDWQTCDHNSIWAYYT